MHPPGLAQELVRPDLDGQCRAGVAGGRAFQDALHVADAAESEQAAVLFENAVEVS